MPLVSPVEVSVCMEHRLTCLLGEDVDLKKAAKLFSNKFATGASVTKNNIGVDEIVIQGDVAYDVCCDPFAGEYAERIANALPRPSSRLKSSCKTRPQRLRQSLVEARFQKSASSLEPTAVVTAPDPSANPFKQQQCGSHRRQKEIDPCTCSKRI